jgi:hypothetical protein
MKETKTLTHHSIGKWYSVRSSIRGFVSGCIDFHVLSSNLNELVNNIDNPSGKEYGLFLNTNLNEFPIF